MSAPVEDRGETAAEGLLTDDRTHDGPAWLRALLGTAAVAAASALSLLLLGAPERSPSLPTRVARHLDAAAVGNSVNAVLLDFRSWDTLLEVTVVLAAVVGVWSLDRDTPPRSRDLDDRNRDPVLHELARLVVPLSATVAVYLLWVGAYGPGGGFQAGAVLAGGAVLLAAAGYVPPLTAASRTVRSLAAAGLLAFLAVGGVSLSLTGSFLDYPAGLAYPAVLVLESALAVAVAVALTELFVDVPAVPDPDPSLERVHPTGDPLGRVLSRPGEGDG